MDTCFNMFRISGFNIFQQFLTNISHTDSCRFISRMEHTIIRTHQTTFVENSWERLECRKLCRWRRSILCQRPQHLTGLGSYAHPLKQRSRKNWDWGQLDAWKNGGYPKHCWISLVKTRVPVDFAFISLFSTTISLVSLCGDIFSRIVETGFHKPMMDAARSSIHDL